MCNRYASQHSVHIWTHLNCKQMSSTGTPKLLCCIHLLKLKIWMRAEQSRHNLSEVLLCNCSKSSTCDLVLSEEGKKKKEATQTHNVSIRYPCALSVPATNAPPVCGAACVSTSDSGIISILTCWNIHWHTLGAPEEVYTVSNKDMAVVFV